MAASEASSGLKPSRLSNNRSGWPALSSPLVLLSLVSSAVLAVVYLACVRAQPVYASGSLAPDARGGGAGSCRMSFMSPAYLRLDGFGREYTRLGAGPWGIYLYREAGWDTEPLLADGSLSLSGSPVVFVPGNAGSFRQVRSLASAASRAWWELPGIRKKGAGGKHGASLDFFALDYNDDFSAFHGQTLLDQSEYLADAIRFILSLYHKKDGRPDPTSVIVVAHSMGGIVARAAFLHPHYQSHSISTLITIATPHVVPPVTVDRSVGKVYDAVNGYWRRGYGLDPSVDTAGAAREELSDLVTISLSGGLSDVTIASEAVSLASLIPLDDSHGFTVFTTSIPGVATPIDHLAMLWCQQLLAIIADSLLSIVDVSVARGVVSREERVKKLGETLLGGLETGRKQVDGREVALGALQQDAVAQVLAGGERLVIRDGLLDGRKIYMMPIPPVKTYASALAFTLLTSASIGRSKVASVEVYACAPNAAAAGGAICTALFPSHASSLPQSPHSPTSPILPLPVEDGMLGHVAFDVAALGQKDTIVVLVKPGTQWALAEFGDKITRVQVVDKSIPQLLLGGFKLQSYPSTPSLVSELWIPALDTSLLTLKVKVFRSECQESTSLFAPMLRQYSPLLHESRFFPNVRVASLYTHSSGPYLPLPTSPFAASGSRLQFFLDPTCAQSSTLPDIAIEVTVDVWATLGALVIRYRMAAVAFPFSLVMLVVARQLKEYDAGNVYIAFGPALGLFARDTLLPLLGLLTLASLGQSLALGTHLASSESLYAAEPGHAHHASLAPAWISNLLLGNRSASFLFLAAFLVFACVSVVTMEYLVLQGLVGGAAWLTRIAHQRGPKAFRMVGPSSEVRDSLLPQRILSMTVLILLVLFFAPYQFAFIVTFLVHFFCTIRSLLHAQDVSSPTTPASTKRLWDRYHYNFSILFIMLCLLPINALILVVWVRNLAVGWLAPFSSDHNVLSVAGFLLNIEALHSGKVLSRSKNRLKSSITTVLFGVTSAYGFLFGIRYAHNIYPLTNVLFFWLAVLSSDLLVGAAHDAVIGKRRISAPPRRIAVASSGKK